LERATRQEQPSAGAAGAAGPALTQAELGGLQRQAERTAATAEAAARAAAGRPDTAAGLFEAGKVWELLNMPGKAIQLYERALRADPNFHEATARLAVNLIRAGRPQEALRVATELARNAPEFRFKTINGTLNVTSFTVLGDALRENGDVDGAVRAYEQALDIEGDDLHSLARLAELYLVQGEVSKAVALEPRVDSTFNADLKATLRLTTNERTLLPAISGLRLNAVQGRVAV
jgi:tetratricopeptide (TPR) repeat protein